MNEKSVTAQGNLVASKVIENANREEYSPEITLKTLKKESI